MQIASGAFEGQRQDQQRDGRKDARPDHQPKRVAGLGQAGADVGYSPAGGGPDGENEGNQGNILRPGEVVPNAVRAFLGTNGAITDRVMAALETADRFGGDSRCTCPVLPAAGPLPAIPCEGKTAHIAYILMAEKGDTSGDSHNNGKYAMYLTVSQPAPDHGPNVIKEGENLNPVKTLRLRYDAWRRTQPASFK